MLFDFGKSGTSGEVDVYVPFCPYHEAGFFFQTDSYSETDLFACATKTKDVPREYSIKSSGISLPTSAPLPVYPCFPPSTTLLKTYTPSASGTKRTPATADGTVYLLSAPDPGSRRLKEKANPLDKRLFKISVPKPWFIASLYTDSLEVCVDSTSPRAIGKLSASAARQHATSLRFYYPWDAKSPIHLMPPYGKPLPITPPTYREVPVLSDIEIRYEGIGLEDDNDPHSDAHSCFASLTAMAGANWWLNYGDGRTSPSSHMIPREPFLKLNPCPQPEQQKIKTGDDCHAPLLTIGLTL